jgi:hypothetical protein
MKPSFLRRAKIKGFGPIWPSIQDYDDIDSWNDATCLGQILGGF